MSDELIKAIATNAVPIAALSALCYLLSQARRVTFEIASNTDKIGPDGWKRMWVVNRAVFNFYLVLALVLVTAVRFLQLIQEQLFVALLVGILGGLGIKLTADLRKDDQNRSDQSKGDDNGKR